MKPKTTWRTNYRRKDGRQISVWLSQSVFDSVVKLAKQEQRGITRQIDLMLQGWIESNTSQKEAVQTSAQYFANQKPESKTYEPIA